MFEGYWRAALAVDKLPGVIIEGAPAQLRGGGDKWRV